MTLQGAHIHIGLKDLPGGIAWLGAKLGVAPSYQNERMAVIPFGPLSLILDAAEADVPVTLAYLTKNCDDAFTAIVAKGATVIAPPAHQAWGPRTAYLQGPGALVIELEQDPDAS